MATDSPQGAPTLQSVNAVGGEVWHSEIGISLPYRSLPFTKRRRRGPSCRKWNRKEAFLADMKELSRSEYRRP